VSVLAVLARTRAQDAQSTDVTVFQGETGLLTCSGRDVHWYRIVQPSPTAPLEIWKIFESPDIWHTNRGTKYDVNGTYNLVIKDAQARSDGGAYMCNTNENPQALLNTNFLVLGKVFLYLCELYSHA